MDLHFCSASRAPADKRGLCFIDIDACINTATFECNADKLPFVHFHLTDFLMAENTRAIIEIPITTGNELLNALAYLITSASADL